MKESKNLLETELTEIIDQLVAFIPPSRTATTLIRELRRCCAFLAEHQTLEAQREAAFLKAREKRKGREREPTEG